MAFARGGGSSASRPRTDRPPPQPASAPDAHARLRAEAKQRVLRLALVLLVTSVLSPAVTHLSPAKAYVVASGSMEPTIPVGSLVVAGPGEVQVGTVVVYWTPVGGAVEVHRVVEVRHAGNETSYVTRGDNNQAADSFTVPAGHVRGVVKGHTPYLGYLWLLPVGLQAGLFAALLALYLAITAWDARLVLRPRRPRWLAGLLVLVLLAPGALGSVAPDWPASPLTANVASTPLPMSAGSMAAASIAADQGSATVTANAPKLWKEIVLWPCDATNGCASAIPSGAYTTVDGSITHVDPADYGGSATFYLEAYLKAPAGQTASVILRNMTDGVDVAASEVTTSSSSYVLLRSAGFTLSGSKDYQFRMKNSGTSAGGELSMVKLVLEQQFPAKTETQVRLSSIATTSSALWTVPARAGKWRYDATGLDGLTGAYFEFVANSGATDGEVRLVDRTTGTVVSSTTFLSNVPFRSRSFDISGSMADGHEYEVEFASVVGGATGITTLYLARIVLQQASFTKTVRYADLTWATSTTSTGFVTVGYPARYHMDSEWGGVTGYFEATLANSGAGGTSSATLWDNTAGSAVSGSQVDVTGTTRTRVRSASVALDRANGTYAVQLKASAGTADLRDAWLIVLQVAGKTYDDALRTANAVNACTWSFTLVAGPTSGLARLTSATIALRGNGVLQDQVKVAGGVLTQGSGAAVSVPYPGNLQHVVTTNPSSAGSSSISASLSGTCSGTGIHTVQPVTYTLA